MKELDEETKSKQKVALACPSFSGGGAEKVMVTLANKFHEWGYDLDFIVANDKGPYKHLLDSNINKIVLAKPESGKVAKRIQASISLYRYFRTTSAEVMVSTTRTLTVFVSVVKFFSRSKIKFFVREADHLHPSHFCCEYKKKILFYFLKKTYQKAHGCIANSCATKKDLIDLLEVSPDNICVIYNPLDIKIQAKQKNSNSIKILAAGRLTKKKNFSDLIKTIPILQKKYGKISLDILGEGPERESLQNLIDQLGLADSVSLVGFSDNPYEFYVNASVFVQTSLWEGFGYVLAEAMACGTPVVAYDSKGAMREILEDGKYGELTPVGDTQALADAVAKQIEDPTPNELLAEAVTRFDVNLIAEKYLNELGVENAK